MDYKKNRASFYMYYTRSDVAREMGADTGSDLSEISSRLVANSLDCMIASYEDVENIYLKNGFIMNLNNFLSENEKKALKPYFVTKKNEADKVIGISLKDCKKYRTLFTGQNTNYRRTCSLCNYERNQRRKKLCETTHSLPLFG